MNKMAKKVLFFIYKTVFIIYFFILLMCVVMIKSFI